MSCLDGEVSNIVMFETASTLLMWNMTNVSPHWFRIIQYYSVLLQSYNNSLESFQYGGVAATQGLMEKPFTGETAVALGVRAPADQVISVPNGIW